ncbi:MAG TPA: hypothetical protein VG711_10870 [Phycisphaerales bacterium]|nr:hypothetical protein [Phycisphaerales bacterium]
MTRAEFERMTEGAEVVSADEHGPKVLRTSAGLMVKLFRRKRLISSAMWNPYANRFAHAAKRMNESGFASVQVQMVRRVTGLNRDAVFYEELGGEALRSLLNDDASAEKWLAKLAEEMARLHEKGVYFRAMHFGNVLVNVQETGIGYIDVSEMKFYARALSIGMRARNFRPMTRYAEDREGVERFGVQRFVETYMKAAKLIAAEREAFVGTLRKVHEMFAKVAITVPARTNVGAPA